MLGIVMINKELAFNGLRRCLSLLTILSLNIRGRLVSNGTKVFRCRQLFLV